VPPDHLAKRVRFPIAMLLIWNIAEVSNNFQQPKRESLAR